MKKRSDQSLNVKPLTPADSKPEAKPHVRYIGFEAIDAGRRLRFRVKPNGRAAVEVTFDVPDALFINTAGISIQDAAPMAFEKLVELFATQGMLDSDKLCLTQEDIAEYLKRHLIPQKRTHSTDNERRRSDIAA